MQRFVGWMVAVCLVVASIGGVTVYSESEGLEYYTVLLESSSGQVLEESGSDVRVQVGTLNKVMVALLVAERVSSGDATLDTELTASSSVQGLEGATVWLLPGERMSVRDLLKATLIGNANDSTVVLAEYLAQSETQCVELMNAKAEALGMYGTHYTNVCGYDDPQQYSTAYDTGLLGCAFLRYDFLQEVASTYLDSLRDGATQLVNEDYLTRSYEGLTGIKASHLDGSYSAMVSAERDGTSYLAVVLDGSDRDATLSKARSLLNRAFSSYVTTEPSFSSELMKPLTVKGGTESSVLVRPSSLRSITVAKGSEDVESVVFLPDYVSAPVRKGQRVGRVCFYLGDTLVYETDLVACDGVQRMDFSKAFRKLLHYLLEY